MAKRPNPDRPKVFVGSSTESSGVAGAIVAGLKNCQAYTFDVIFELATTNIEALENELDEADFAVLVMDTADVTASRGKSFASPRDNVLLEFGMFIGRLGRERCFAVVPDDAQFELPTDLLGVGVSPYLEDEARDNPDKAASRSVAKIDRLINKLGPRSSVGSRLGDDQSERSRSPWMSDGWKHFAGSGMLEPLTNANLFDGLWIVHARHGLGQVVGFGPSEAQHRTVQLRFDDGLATLVLGESGLFLANP